MICAKLFVVFVTDVIVTCFDNHVVGRCYCQLVVDWLMLLAIVADVKATFFICVNPQMLILADVIATFLG